jgi:dihydroflavonol-4-reductase
VLITGATGFVGANVSRLLLERGHRVRALVRASSNRANIDGLDIETVTGDLRDADSVFEAVKGCQAVYHIAAEYSFWSRHPEVLYKSNIEGTKNVMEASLRHGVERVVYTSTVGAVGLSAQPEPCNEETPLAPGQLNGHYKRSKYEAEQAAMSYVAKGLPLVVVCPSAPIGPWDRKPTPTGKMVVDFMTGKMPAYLNTGLNLIHVSDVAEGHVLAASKGRVGERYILGNRNMSFKEILSALASVTGKKAPKLRIPYPMAWLAGFTSTKVADWVTHRPPSIALESVLMAKKHMYFDSSKAVRELGLRQTPVERAMEDAVEWFSRQGFFN